MSRPESYRERRERIAIAMMQGVLSSDILMTEITTLSERKRIPRDEVVVGVAMVYTDSIIEELKNDR